MIKLFSIIARTIVVISLIGSQSELNATNVFRDLGFLKIVEHNELQATPNGSVNLSDIGLKGGISSATIYVYSVKQSFGELETERLLEYYAYDFDENGNAYQQNSSKYDNYNKQFNFIKLPDSWVMTSSKNDWNWQYNDIRVVNNATKESWIFPDGSRMIFTSINSNPKVGCYKSNGDLITELTICNDTINHMSEIGGEISLLNAHGYPILTKTYIGASNGSAAAITQYAYNENGDFAASEKTTDLAIGYKSENHKETIAASYKYDESNNWTECYLTRNGKPYKYILRQIYYATVDELKNFHSINIDNSQWIRKNFEIINNDINEGDGHKIGFIEYQTSTGYKKYFQVKSKIKISSVDFGDDNTITLTFNKNNQYTAHCKFAFVRTLPFYNVYSDGEYKNINVSLFGLGENDALLYGETEHGDDIFFIINNEIISADKKVKDMLLPKIMAALPQNNN